MSKRRVVVTGLGAVTPVGLSVKESWDNIVAGQSGVAPLTHFDVSEFSVQFGASVKNFDVTTVMSRKDAKKMDTFIHYGIAAAVSYLASPLAGYVTGETLHVNGGMYMS
jgi:3-oxoacyl-[acyl-carrier-protein] synthase II